MNAWKTHNVKWISPSLINSWIDHPAYTLLKIAGIRDGEAGPAAWRGNAVETGMVQFLEAKAKDVNVDSTDMLNSAIEHFNTQKLEAVSNHNPEKIDREIKNIPRYLKSGIQYMEASKIDEMPITQGKVVLQLEGLPDTLGYFDMRFQKTNTVIDVKTVAQSPRSPTAAHSRQLAVYWAGTQSIPWVWYVGVNGVKTFTISNPQGHLDDFINAAKSLERVLSHSTDIFECCQLVYPDFDHWIWGEQTKAAARDIWNIKS